MFESHRSVSPRSVHSPTCLLQHKNHQQQLYSTTMKFLALAALAIASVAAWSDEACPSSEIGKLIELVNEPSLEQCQEDSTYTFVPPGGPPDDVQIALMCGSTACNSTIAALIALDPSDCQVSFSTGVSLNVKQLVTELPAKCASA